MEQSEEKALPKCEYCGTTEELTEYETEDEGEALFWLCPTCQRPKGQ